MQDNPNNINNAVLMHFDVVGNDRVTLSLLRYILYSEVGAQIKNFNAQAQITQPKF